MIKCETHLHTYGGSPCAQTKASKIAQLYQKSGYKAIVSTNHYIKYLFDEYYPSGSLRSKIQYFIDIYRDLKYHCNKVGIKVFLGMEFTPLISPIEGIPQNMDILCYGITEEFLLNHPELNMYNQHQLYELFNQHNILAYQAHPYRDYCVRANPKYIHGVEVFNGHPSQHNNNELALKFAKENKLLMISGSDFHEYQNYRVDEVINGGIMIPDYINDSVMLADFLRNNKDIILLK